MVHKGNLIIADWIQQLKPPIPQQELKLLHDGIWNDGVLNPLVVWKGHNILVDGYYRYIFCEEHGIPYDVVELDFADENEVKLWVVREQLGRRNLTPFQKCEMVLPMESVIAAEAKRRQGWRSDIKGIRGGRPMETMKILADMAGVSTGTLRHVKYILDNGDRKMIRRARCGELSVYGAYRSLAQKCESPSETVAVRVERLAAKPNLQPIRDAVESLIDRVTDGDASPKTIIAELNRMAELIDGLEP